MTCLLLLLAGCGQPEARPGPLPPGAEVTVVEGDPGQPGPFRLRMELPGSYEVRPHYHSSSETITVLEGSILFGHGQKSDDDKLRPLAAGDEVSLEAKAPHFVRTREPCVIEVRSTGPFDMT